MPDPRELLPHTWLFPAEDGELNSGVLLSEAGAVVIDPGASPGNLEALDAFVKSSGGSVAVVAITHSRGGRVPDLGLWPGAGHLIPFDLSGVPGVDPLVEQTLSAMGWRALLFGPARLALYSDRQRALFCGDMLSELHIPYLREGSAPYLEALAEVETLDCRLLIPASGPPAQGKRQVRQRLERDRNYVYSLVRHVRTAMAAPATLERAIEVARTVYEDYPFLEEHLHNLRAVWQELDDSPS